MSGLTRFQTLLSNAVQAFHDQRRVDAEQELLLSSSTRFPSPDASHPGRTEEEIIQDVVTELYPLFEELMGNELIGRDAFHLVNFLMTEIVATGSLKSKLAPGTQHEYTAGSKVKDVDAGPTKEKAKTEDPFFSGSPVFDETGDRAEPTFQAMKKAVKRQCLDIDTTDDEGDEEPPLKKSKSENDGGDLIEYDVTPTRDGVSKGL